MDNLKLNKGLLALGLIMTLASLLLGVLLNWLDENFF
jgi:hypothetical protein